MADNTRNINDVMSSGEVEEMETTNVIVGGNIGYTQAADPEYNNMFMRVYNGVTTLYKAPDQDVKWSVNDTTNISVGTTEIELLSLVNDGHDVTAENGSFMFYAKVDNDSNFTATLTITFKVDGTPVGSQKVQEVAKKSYGIPISIFGNAIAIAAGSAISVSIVSDRTVALRGDLSPTTFTVTEAQAAPVTQTIEVPNDFGNAISRAEIDSAISGAGINGIKNDFTAFIVDAAGTAWFVKYLAKIDKFAVEKMGLK